MSGGRTTWMGIDIAWMRRELNVRLAMQCGGETFSVLLALWLDAKQQRSVDGRVKFGYVALGREAFVDPRKVEEIVQAAIEVGVITDLQPDDHGRLRGVLTDFEADDRRGRAALKKAGQRAESAGGTDGDTGGQDGSLSPSVALEEKRVERKTADAVLSGAVPSPDPTVVRLCSLHSDLSRARTDTPASSRRLLPTRKWHVEMDRLLRLDGYTAEQVEYAIRWVDRHTFWAQNCLSVDTLRKHFPRFVAAIKSEQQPRARPADDKNTARRERTRERLSSLMAPTTDDAIEGTVASAA